MWKARSSEQERESVLANQSIYRGRGGNGVVLESSVVCLASVFEENVALFKTMVNRGVQWMCDGTE